MSLRNKERNFLHTNERDYFFRQRNLEYNVIFVHSKVIEPLDVELALSLDPHSHIQRTQASAIDTITDLQPPAEQNAR